MDTISSIRFRSLFRIQKLYNANHKEQKYEWGIDDNSATDKERKGQWGNSRMRLIHLTWQRGRIRCASSILGQNARAGITKGQVSRVICGVEGEANERVRGREREREIVRSEIYNNCRQLLRCIGRGSRSLLTPVLNWTHRRTIPIRIIYFLSLITSLVLWLSSSVSPVRS